MQSRELLAAERKLLTAVLLRALLDYGSSRLKVKAEAESWMFQGDDENEPFSFRWICGQLGVDAEAALETIEELEEIPHLKIARAAA